MSENKEKSSYKNLLTVVILIAVGVLLAWGLFGTNMVAEDDLFKITGLHGQKIDYNDMNPPLLLDNLPDITAKTGGFSLAGKRLGNFTTSEYGIIKLYLFNNTKPYIFIEKKNGDIIVLNMKDPATTGDLYNKLVDKVPAQTDTD